MKSVFFGLVAVFAVALTPSSFAENSLTQQTNVAVVSEASSEQPEVEAIIGGCETEVPVQAVYEHSVCVVGWDASTSILIVSNDPAKITYHAELVQHCVRMSAGPNDPVFAECFLDY